MFTPYVPKEPEDFTMDCANCVSWPVCAYANNLVSKINEDSDTSASLEVHVYCKHFVRKGSVSISSPLQHRADGPELKAFLI